MSVNTDPSTGRISSVSARIDLVSEDLRYALRGGSPLKTTPVTPCTITITINKTPLNVTFPLPVLTNTLKTRIARTSSYIKLIATILPVPATHPSPTFTATLLFTPSQSPNNSNTPIPLCWTTPYTRLSQLPILSITTTTTTTTTTSPSSPLSTLLQVHLNQLPLRRRPPSERARLAIKKSLHNLFEQHAGIGSLRPAGTYGHRPGKSGECVFTLLDSSPDGDRGVDIIVFVSSMRLDLARRSVLLDCAVLALTPGIMVRLGEMRFWERVMSPSEGVVIFKVGGRR
ncbi:hypothetical protein C8A01DRAFT_34363 [Parachaetomium inaequale]|uniref:Uncharacterized protein n=1 Tax=Parachaetomium inaequale TaxID=2588326 RepID=A0AAN6PK97_9PEZI|nr:hypothetical protein C8A01DRAFT_34363 [Parachaetomium inaequale]